jgi:hypothetical protein
MSESTNTTTTTGSLEELKARRSQRREKGGSSSRANVARKSRERAQNKNRARANAPDSGSAGIQSGKGALKSRFGREQALARGSPGTNAADITSDDDDASSGSDSDVGDGQSLLDANGNPTGDPKRSRRQVRKSLITPPVSLKFWQVEGDLGEKDGGQLSYPTVAARLNRAERRAKMEELSQKDSKGTVVNCAAVDCRDYYCDYYCDYYTSIVHNLQRETEHQCNMLLIFFARVLSILPLCYFRLTKFIWFLNYYTSF